MQSKYNSILSTKSKPINFGSDPPQATTGSQYNAVNTVPSFSAGAPQQGSATLIWILAITYLIPIYPSYGAPRAQGGIQLATCAVIGCNQPILPGGPYCAKGIHG